jgi:hypothetical protein
VKYRALKGIDENGQIRLDENVRLPENARVYVIIPGFDFPKPICIRSPRLVHSDQSADFEKIVIPEV